MQTDTTHIKPTHASYTEIPAENAAGTTQLASTAPGQFHVIRRNGKLTSFDASKIAVAMTKAFLAVEGSNAAASRRVHDTVQTLTAQIMDTLTRRLSGSGTIHIEDIQDQVELALMRAGEQKVARSYVLYREERARERATHAQHEPAAPNALRVTLPDGTQHPLDTLRLETVIT